MRSRAREAFPIDPADFEVVSCKFVGSKGAVKEDKRRREG
jgi:hypothetical protein